MMTGSYYGFDDGVLQLAVGLRPGFQLYTNCTAYCIYKTLHEGFFLVFFVIYVMYIYMYYLSHVNL